MKHIPDKAISEFISAAHKIGEYELVQCSSGNLSWRLDNEHMLITESGSWLAELTCDEIVPCRISDLSSLNGLKPSVEAGFHGGILTKRNDIDVVLHFQSPYATAMACQGHQSVNQFYIPEIPYHIGPVGIVPYLRPGSPEFAHAVISVMVDHNLAILRNHGLVTVGGSFKKAIERAVFYELACKVSAIAGKNASPLPKEAVAALRQAGEKAISV